MEGLPRLGALARHFGLMRLQALHRTPAPFGHVRAVFRDVGGAGLMHRLPRGGVLRRSGAFVALTLTGLRHGLRQRRPGKEHDDGDAEGSGQHGALPKGFEARVPPPDCPQA